MHQNSMKGNITNCLSSIHHKDTKIITIKNNLTMASLILKKNIFKTKLQHATSY